MTLRRVAIVGSHPIQHFCPFYRALAADKRVEAKVFFASMAGAVPYVDCGYGKAIRWDGDLTAGFTHEFLPGAVRRSHRLTNRLSRPR